MTVALLAVLALLTTMGWLLPGLSQPTVPFGVRVPAHRVAAPVIGSERERYRRQIAGAAAVAVLAAVLLVVTGHWWPAVAGAVVLSAVTVRAFLSAHRAIAAAKRAEGWYDGVPQATAVDTTLRTRPEAFPWRWTAPALVVVAVTVLFGIVWYPRMPDLLTMHLDGAGTPDRQVPRSVPAAFSPVALQLLLTASLLAVAWAGFHARADLDPADPTAAGARHRRFISGFARRLLVMVACVDAALAVLAWSIWTGGPTLTATALAGLTAAGGVLALVVFALRVGQGGSRLATAGPIGAGVNRRDDDAHWRLGLVYVNPADPAVMVPQRVGVGWTLNLGRPLSWLALGALIAVPVVVIALLTTLS
ncbi:MAG TPA: DUF5808 domain-containing protein [Catenuloplanes sp.]|jgi:uncharacterized membrane protein